MLRFLNSWLDRAQNNASRASPAATSSRPMTARQVEAAERGDFAEQVLKLDEVYRNGELAAFGSGTQQGVCALSAAEAAQAEFELLVRAWGDVLADVGDAEFIEGIRRVEAKLSFFPVPADVMRQVEEARKRTPAVNREALPENSLTFDERCELGTDWCAKILANLRGKMCPDAGASRHAAERQLAGLREMGVEQ